MKLSEKIKALRKGAGMSQEEFGARLNVSRQAITKWESGEGLPDIGNLLALSRMFNLSLDDLLSEEKALAEKLFLYESRVEYDIDAPMDFDIHLRSAAEVTVSGTPTEKLEIVLSSNEIADLSHLLKVKIDSSGRGADIDLHRQDGITETLCRKALHIGIRLPRRYVQKVEVSANVGKFNLRHLEYEHFEFGSKAGEVTLDEISGDIELDINNDVVIRAGSFSGNLSLNQLNAVSTLFLPKDKAVSSRCRGVRTRLLCDSPDLFNSEAPDVIELNGFNSELTVSFGQ